MNFDKVFRGYDPQQVDKYVADRDVKDAQLHMEQKERIQQLADENYTLSQQLKQYQMDEKAISKSLIDSQRLAQEMQHDAQKFSDLVLSRAKIFYATWRTYSQTLIASLSNEEVQQFNALQSKIEQLINAYEGKDVNKEVSSISDSTSTVVATNSVDVTPTSATMSYGTNNPIKRVENASEHAIDLRELTRTDESLENLCRELGLTK